MKHITHRNPVSFLQELTALLQEGYIQDHKYAVYATNNLYEASLVKSNKELECLVPYLPSCTELVIEDYIFSELCYKLQYFLANGWQVDYNVFNHCMISKSFAKVRREEHQAEIYSKEDMEEMTWEEVKEIAKKYGCFNRNRDVLINNILKAQKGE